jgi:hypothetical protein
MEMQLVNVEQSLSVYRLSQFALFLLTSLLVKIASVTVYYPVHTRGCENLE